MNSTEHVNRRVGVAYGATAYAIWGLVPVYFKAIAHVSPFEILAHRIVWSVLLLSTLNVLLRRTAVVRQVLSDRRAMKTLLCTMTLVASNWFVFVWAVANDHVLEASLGYFINPLVNVLLGFLFLGEGLRPWQKVGVVLATIGVAYLTVSIGAPPWIALILAISFGLYGLLRKTTQVDALTGLSIETAVLSPVALTYLILLGVNESGSFGFAGLSTGVLLALAGAVTSIPLLFFAAAARRLRLATMGFLQYIAPTGHFLLAVLAYNEPFSNAHLVAFMFIWTALVIYTLDARRALGEMRLAAVNPRLNVCQDRYT